MFKDSFRTDRRLSVDKSMVAFTGCSKLKQYMPMKPIKRGFKMLSLALETPLLKYIITYKFSQAHLDLFFYYC